MEAFPLEMPPLLGAFYVFLRTIQYQTSVSKVIN